MSNVGGSIRALSRWQVLVETAMFVLLNIRPARRFDNVLSIADVIETHLLLDDSDDEP